MPKISIVAPVYGVEKYIDQFLDSIRKQTFQDFEAILVDDGSKDNCPAILDAFAEEDSRYKVIHQENGGVSKARNTGLAYVKGEYVYIVDSDDWLEPTALEDLWNEAERTHADIIYGVYIREESSGPILRKCWPEPIVADNKASIKALQFAVNSNGYTLNIKTPDFCGINSMGGAPWRALIKMNIIRENNITFDPYVKGLGDDILFTLHLYEYVNKVAYIPKIIYHYRVVDASYSHGFKANYFEHLEKIFEKQEEFLNKFEKGSTAWKSYYMRVLIYLNQGMHRYFKNPGNPKSSKENYDDFKALIKTAPYSDAIKNVPISVFTSKKMRIAFYALRMGFYRFYWKFIDQLPV